MRKRIECRTRDLHQSLLVKLSRAMARVHGKAGVLEIQGAQGAAGETGAPVQARARPSNSLCALQSAEAWSCSITGLLSKDDHPLVV